MVERDSMTGEGQVNTNKVLASATVTCKKINVARKRCTIEERERFQHFYENKGLLIPQDRSLILITKCHFLDVTRSGFGNYRR